MKPLIAATAALLFAALGIGGSAVAVADVQASGGSGTVVDTDGTQGDLAAAVQGTQDSDGDQDAFITGSERAVPQFTAKPK